MNYGSLVILLHQNIRGRKLHIQHIQQRRTGMMKSLLCQPHLLNFTTARPLLPSLMRCASHRTPRWLRGRWEVGLCRSALPEIRNALRLLPSSSPPNGSYQTHWETCGHEETFPNFLKGERLCANSSLLSFLSYFYTFLPKMKLNTPLHTTLIWFFRQIKSWLLWFHITSSHSWAVGDRKNPSLTSDHCSVMKFHPSLQTLVNAFYF